MSWFEDISNEFIWVAFTYLYFQPKIIAIHPREFLLLNDKLCIGGLLDIRSKNAEELIDAWAVEWYEFLLWDR